MLRTTLCCATAALLASALPAFAWYPRDPASNGGFGPGPYPPSYYGWPLDDRTASYYGGANYREYYSYGRGFYFAGYLGPVPGGPVYPFGYRCPAHEPALVHAEPTVPAPFAADPTAAMLNVRVPTDAVVWLEGNPTKQSGASRLFVSPPLERGHDYTYEVRARWKDNGRDVEETRTLTVHAGDRLNVAFPSADAGPKLPPPKPLPAEVEN
jgi:uncharacterized protein (TIGR03000 family)